MLWLFVWAHICDDVVGLLAKVSICNHEVLAGRPIFKPLASGVAKSHAMIAYGCFAVVFAVASNLGIEIASENGMAFFVSGIL